MDKIMLSLTTFADELDREKARQRTYDALERKARAGHVTGGACFGYRNVEVVGADGRRSHVAQEVDDAEAAIVRQVFELCATGRGQKGIAKQLNAEGAWAPSSVREVLFRERYRGVIVWNRTRKRDRWGQSRRTNRDEADWVRVEAPALEIVDEGLWAAAHRRLGAARQLYLKGTKGRPFGRPPVGSPSKYLLTNLAQCGLCGSSMKVRTRSHRHVRAKFYGCSGYQVLRPARSALPCPASQGSGRVTRRPLTDDDDYGIPIGVARCEAIILEQWTRMQDKEAPVVASEAARVILKAMAEEHKLTGAYAPAKVALTDPTGDEPFRSLSDEALDKKIAELQAAIDGTDLTKLAVIDVKPVGGNGSKGNGSRRNGEPKKGGGDAV